MSKYFFLSVCSKQTVMLQTHINMLEKNFKYLLETKNPYLMDGRNVTLNTKINSLTSKHIRKKISWKCIFNNTTSYYWVLLILSRMKFWFNFECMLVTQTKVVAYQKMLWKRFSSSSVEMYRGVRRQEKKLHCMKKTIAHRNRDCTILYDKKRYPWMIEWVLQWLVTWKWRIFHIPNQSTKYWWYSTPSLADVYESY